MFNSLLAEATGNGSNATMWILLVLLGVLIVAYIFSYFRRKKYNQETTNMLNALKPGDKVKTYSGFYGTVVSIKETTDGKVVTLETGDEKHKSFTSIDSNAIYCIDKKEDIVYDTEGNVVMPVSEDEKQEAKNEVEGQQKEVTTESIEEEALKTINEEESDAKIVVEEASEEDKKPTKKRTTKK